MISAVLVMLGGLVLVLVGGWLFTNSMEFISHRYRLGGSFVGAVISPIFTSIPELVVFLVALYVHGGVEGEEVGIGTVLGEPFAIATIVYPVIFIAVALGLASGTRDDAVLEVRRELTIPYVTFTALYPVVLLPIIIPSRVGRVVVSVLLLVAYVLYIGKMHGSQGTIIEGAEELYLSRLLGGVASLILQVTLSTILIFLGSRYLVDGVVNVAKYLGVDPLTISILLVPLATVIPESITALMWVYRGRDTEAMAALIGEKVLYSTVYPALGLSLTQWTLNIDAVISVITVEATSLVVLYHVLRGRVTWDVGALGVLGYITYLMVSRIL